MEPIKGNFLQLEQVVINLLSNACQSTPAGNGNVTIVTWYDSVEGTVGIDVEDDGVGIVEIDLDKICDPFYTTKRESGGTGLGLSISYGIVKAHGGRLEINSSLGHGTSARIVLPVSGD